MTLPEMFHEFLWWLGAGIFFALGGVAVVGILLSLVVDALFYALARAFDIEVATRAILIARREAVLPNPYGTHEDDDDYDE